MKSNKKYALVLFLIISLTIISGCGEAVGTTGSSVIEDTVQPHNELYYEPEESDTQMMLESNGNAEMRAMETDDSFLDDSPTGRFAQDYCELIPFDNTPDWYSVYAQIISAYLSFKNGEQPDTIILGSPLTERYYFLVRGWGIIVFALHDINNNGSPELIIGYTIEDEHGKWHSAKVSNVYTLDSGSLERIVASHITDETHVINMHSIWYSEGNIIEVIKEYSLSPNGTLIEEYLIAIDHESNEIIKETGKSLNDTPAELNWKNLSEFFSMSTDGLTE